jgi:putative DNA primase/helicase
MSTQAAMIEDKVCHFLAYGEEYRVDYNAHISFDDVKRASLGSIDMIVQRYLSDAKLADAGKEWTGRNPTRNDAKAGSFKINRRTGVWSDFATGESGGDMIDFVMFLTGKTNIEAKNELAELLNVKSSVGSTSLTGNIPASGLRLVEKPTVAAPTTISVAPAAFPLRTSPDEEGKPKFIKAGEAGPQRYPNEKRRHIYRQGGVPVRIKILKTGEDRAYNAYRVVDDHGASGWQFKKPAGFEDVPYFDGNNPFDAKIDRIVFWPEGEKDTDTIENLGGLAFTFGGAGDGLPLGCEQYVADRNIVILADNDDAGRAHAEKKAALASKVAASVKVVHFAELDEHGDVSDWIASGKTFEDLKARVIAADPWQPSTVEPAKEPPEAKLPYGYSFSNRGLMWKNPEEEKPEIHIAGHFDVEAMTRNGDSNSWGLLLRWKDPDGKEHRFALPRELLSSDGNEARSVLMDQGFYVAPSKDARSKFNAFLLQVTSPNRALATDRVGWNGNAFVLPDECFGGNPGETLLLQNSTAHEHSFRQAGSLEEWQEIPTLAVGNSRLILAISMAFAGPLVGPCSEEGGGVHLKGPSSIGKSTALKAGASVWGSGDNAGYVKSWRATANGLEGVCLNHNDTFLCLDEMAQVSAKDAGEAAYMISNGAGKVRSSRDGVARNSAKFRVIFLSSGEIGLADKVAEERQGRRVTAGQQVRIVDVSADAGKNLGLFEDLHGFESGKALSKHIVECSKRVYGTAGRAFLAAIVPEIDDIKRQCGQVTAAFCEQYLPEDADGQVARVAQRFALIGFAGELAVRLGIIRVWKAGDAIQAAGICFEAWLNERGHTGAAEIHGGIQAVRSFLQAHGLARFVPAWEEEEQTRIPNPQREVCGYRKQTENGWDYYINDVGWAEMCAGFNSKEIAKALIESKALRPNSEGRAKKEVRIPIYGKARYYHIAASFLQEEENGG